MSSGLSLPAIRNFACCHTNRARSRVVKYLRAASPRANQNSDAPIIIVLSTSKKAAAAGSGSTAGGPLTSAAAAEASPATCARVPGSGSAGRPARRRNGTRGTGTSQADGTTADAGATLTGPGRRADGGQQEPTTIGPRQMLISGGPVLGGGEELEGAPAEDARDAPGAVSGGSGSPGGRVLGVLACGCVAAPVLLPNPLPEPPAPASVPPPAVGSAAVLVTGRPEADCSGSGAVPGVGVAPPDAVGGGTCSPQAPGTGPYRSEPVVVGPAGQVIASRSAVPRPATSASRASESSMAASAPSGVSGTSADSPADCRAAQPVRRSSGAVVPVCCARVVSQAVPSVVCASMVCNVWTTSSGEASAARRTGAPPCPPPAAGGADGPPG